MSLSDNYSCLMVNNTDSMHCVTVFLFKFQSSFKLWDAQTGQCVLTFPVDGTLLGCAFHPDGEHVVACGEQGVYFLQLVMEVGC